MFSSLSLLNSSAPKSSCLFATLQYRNCTFHCLFSFLSPHRSSQVRKLEVSTISIFFPNNHYFGEYFLPPNAKWKQKLRKRRIFWYYNFSLFFFEGCSVHTTASALAHLEFVVPRRAITPSQYWMRRCRRRWVGNTWTSLIVVVRTPTGEWWCEKRWNKKQKINRLFLSLHFGIFLVAFWAIPFAFFWKLSVLECRRV